MCLFSSPEYPKNSKNQNVAKKGINFEDWEQDLIKTSGNKQAADKKKMF